jgi:hypothetical protein
MNPAERRIEFPPHVAERGGQRRAPPDQHIIVAVAHGAAGVLAGRKPHHFAQPPPYAIALHCITDLSRNREADPHRTILSAPPRLYHEGSSRRPHPARRRTEIRPARQSLHDKAATAAIDHALSRLRPRARRAASTLRPPLVAIRVRKPCRRLRTNLLGW